MAMDVGHLVTALLGLATGLLTGLLAFRKNVIPALHKLADLTETEADDEFVDRLDHLVESAASHLLLVADDEGKVTIDEVLEALGVELVDEELDSE